MNILLAIETKVRTIKTGPRLFLLVILSVALTVLIDFLEARFYHLGFYWSESLLFSMFWWFFLPLLFFQYRLARHRSEYWFHLGLAIALIGVHLAAYPAFIWLVSRLLYAHTFRYWQTLEFALNEHGSKLTLLYTIPVTLWLFFQRKQPAVSFPASQPPATPASDVLTTIMVTENNQTTGLATSDILYFSANSPYVTIHHKTRKYVHSHTLKSLMLQLDPNAFVRIHKSLIVNLSQVQSYRSRLNGDYDLTLRDGTPLRISRNYAAAFKAAFKHAHQVTTENHPLTESGL